MWIYFLIVISAIILLFVIPHFIVSYLLFRRYFARRSDEEIKNYFFNSSYYDSVRGTMLESLNRLNELDCRVLEITSFDNISIRGYYYPNNSKKTIILAHGHHADPRCIFAYTAERFYKEGFNVLQELVNTLGLLPKTVLVYTQSNGTHMYFKLPPNRQFKRKIGNCIDIQTRPSFNSC